MNRERLQHLKTILSKIGPNFRFDMGRFISPSSCGTAGCALGYASLDPVFQRAGLTPDFNVDNICFQSHVGYGAGQEFFELTCKQANYVFNPNYYLAYASEITPNDVIGHIDALLSLPQ